MTRTPVIIHLTPGQAAIYDGRDDSASLILRRAANQHAVELLATGSVSSVKVTHPAGFVAWYYEAPSPLATDASWFTSH
jgi:hypothetical protein